MSRINTMEATNMDAADIYNFAIAKDKICYRLVNKKLNNNLLSAIPHRDFHGLAIIYCINLETTEDSVKSVKITNRLTELWGVDEEQLYKLACKNTPKINRGCVMPLYDVLNGLTGMTLLKDEDRKKAPYEGFDISVGREYGLPMYIATTVNQINGACVILYAGLLKAVAEKIGSFFVLPSSIHEVIIFPGDIKDAGSMAAMVKEVNCTEVREEDILSNSCYYYNAESHSLDIVG